MHNQRAPAPAWGETTMKIDQNRPNLDTVGGLRQEQLREERAAAAERAAQDDRTDQVRVSTTSQLAATAAAAAGEAPDVRPEAVARARALLDSGELGKNAERLADALIDHAIDRG
jgi:flagellar biosynthesis anti-sigma factor FlgM